MNRFDRTVQYLSFESLGVYFQKYTVPKFNTTYGNDYGLSNTIGLKDPYAGNLGVIKLENQNIDSKYTSVVQRELSNFKDVTDVSLVANSTHPYLEYTTDGLSLVEFTGNYTAGLDQIHDTSTTQNIISPGGEVPKIANVNFADVPSGVKYWYKLVDQAVRADAEFLLPARVVRDIDISIPIYVKDMGGFYIIEEIEEYSNPNDIINVKLIKLI